MEISELDGHDQMRAMASVGRLNPVTSLNCLKHMMLATPSASITAGVTAGNGERGGCLPRLHELLTGAGGDR